MHCYLAAFDQAHLGAAMAATGHGGMQHSTSAALSMNPITTMLPSTCPRMPIRSHRIACTVAARAWVREWICWYRFVDGGRDKVGRPVCCVSGRAFVKRDDHRGPGLVGCYLLAGLPRNRDGGPYQGARYQLRRAWNWHWDPPSAIADSSDNIKELLAWRSLNTGEWGRPSTIICNLWSRPVRPRI